MREVTITLPSLHPAQQEIKDNAKRFNYVGCGRRFGKSELGKTLAVEKVVPGERVGYWCPTYKDISEVWKETKYTLDPIIKSKNEQLKQIITITGGILDFWSMEKPDNGRGRKYHRVIIDEAAKPRSEYLEQAWKEAIRPTLTDYKGDAWFLTTPKGYNHFTYELFNYQDQFDNWISWKKPTTDNPYIPKEEVEEARLQLDPITFAQEYLAEFTSKLQRPFLYSFQESHISEEAKRVDGAIYLSFDFNVDPSVCLVSQEVYRNGETQILFIDEIYLNNSNIWEVCDVILSKYSGSHFKITGDASGKNRHHTGNLHAYHIIKEKLQLKDIQIHVPKVNPPVKETRVVCNSILHHNRPRVLINPICKELIKDCRFVEVNEEGEIDKTKDKHRSHLLDAFRYQLYNFHKGNIKKYL